MLSSSTHPQSPMISTPVRRRVNPRHILWLILPLLLSFASARLARSINASEVEPLRSPQNAAAVITVTSTADSGPGSLRQAISVAAPGETINFAPNFTGSIVLTSGELVISKDLTIQGPGPNFLTVRRSSGAADFRIFNINAGVTVAISGLTLSNGKTPSNNNQTPNSGNGGGILSLGSSLSLSDCVISGNVATNFSGGVDCDGGSLTITNCTITGNIAASGGGIGGYSGATLTIQASTINGNQADNSAAIELEGVNATIANSTISENTSSTSGGAITNLAVNGRDSSLTFINCTLVNNRSFGVLTSDGGTASNSAVTRLKNTIFSDFSGQNFRKSGARATITSLGNNLDNDGTSGFTNGVNGDIVGAAASRISTWLGPLADNGGPTRTHALLLKSPARRAGDSLAAPATDQRGMPRASPACDIGAFESQRYTVTTTADSGPGSLRQAILDNNGNGGGLITFDIPGGGVRTIAPASALPPITRTVAIDGYTQPGARPNSQFDRNDAILLIELSGANAGLAEGIELSASYCTVRGLVINRFTNGILIRGPNGFLNDIVGNFIGCDPTGMRPAPNTFAGVNILDGAYSNVIGGIQFSERNLISGNQGAGVFIQSVNTVRNFVQGNFIGLAADGVTALGNTAGTNDGFGVLIGYGARGNFIDFNEIAFNASAGVTVFTDSSAPDPINNSITANSIYSNGGPGIDLGNDGITPNDSGDADTGPNRLQNFPDLIAVASNGQSVQGRLDSSPNSDFEIQIYHTPSSVPPVCQRQGKTEVGRMNVRTDANGISNFVIIPFNNPTQFGPGFLTATATNSLGGDNGDTSEFSDCLRVGGAPPIVRDITVISDLITAVEDDGQFTGQARVLVDGVGFSDPARIEDNGKRVVQAGLLINGKTIDQAAPPGQLVKITFINGNGGSVTVDYRRSRELTPRPGSSRSGQPPPLVLTSVVIAGDKMIIRGELTGAPKTTYLIYFFFTPTGDGAGSLANGACPNPIGQEESRNDKKLLCPILDTDQCSKKVTTDDRGRADPFTVTFPKPDSTGFVSAVAVPVNEQGELAGSSIRVTSNCVRPSPPPPPIVRTITVTDDRIVAAGYGFLPSLRIFIGPAVGPDDEFGFVEFDAKPEVSADGRQAIQRGRLKNGMSITQAIPVGAVVRIKFDNGNDSKVTEAYKR